MSRDPSRIPALLERLHVVWQRHPDLRLGQLLLAGTPEDRLFNAECDDIVRHLERVLK